MDLEEPMLFNSLSFAVFLPIVFAVYWLVPKRYQWAVLLIASYYFYITWDVKYAVLMLFATVVTYWAARRMEGTGDPKRRKWLMRCALIASLGVLFVFKYFNFFSQSVASALSLFGLRYDPLLINLLPIGISFYTFQTLSYVIDVYTGRIPAETHFGRYAAFVAFFPKLVAGPIERAGNLLPQLREEHSFDYDLTVSGLRLMFWGFFKKIILADGLSLYVDKAFASPVGFEGAASLIAILFFAVQIYCDFSGYSDIAIGCARLFNIRLMKNFNLPYFASSVKEFWGRWHISLSTWFRDYVYIPLGGNRVPKWRHKLNLIITFLVSGLWHGASWTFVVWGGLHGVVQALESMLPGKGKKEGRVGIATGWILTMAFVTLAWTFFQANSISDAIYMLFHMFDGITSPIAYLKAGCRALGLTKLNLACLGFSVIVLTVYDFLSLKRDIPTDIGKLKTPVRWTLYYAAIACFAALLIILGNTGGGQFIYFQF